MEEEVLGDLDEKFRQTLQKKSQKRARLNYWFQVLNYVRPFAIKASKNQYMNRIMSTVLLKNYLTVAFRLFKKQKSFTLINVMGLALGICSSLFIYLWVQDELQYNSYLQDGERVFNVLNRETQTNGEINTYRYSPYNLKAVLQEEYPIVENASILSNGNWMAFRIKEELVEWAGVDASPEFFELFEVPFIKGGYKEMFENSNALAISESVAEIYFGKDWRSQDVIGEMMENDLGEVYKLVGIYADFPKHSTIQYDFVVPFSNRLKKRRNLTSWNNSSSQLFVKLKADVSSELANSILVNAIIDHRKGDFLVDRELFLQSFEDMYLYNRYENGRITGGRIEYVRLLSVGAIFILILACINFMNLSTARSAHRFKETGVRKVMGARRYNLRNQFLVESLLITLFAVVIALIIIAVLIEPFNQLLGMEIAFQVLTLRHAFYLLGFIFGLGILAGLYPAFYLSSLAAITAFKGRVSKRGKTGLFRKSLVVFQFAITMIMITSALTVYKQVSYIQNKNIGLDRSNLIRTFSYDAKENLAFKHELLKKPGIESVTMVNQLLIDIRNSTSAPSWDTKLETDDLEFYMISVNPDFLPTTKIELKEGRNFSWDIQSDSANYIINEAAQALMDMKDPIGKNLSVWGVKGKIVGVVKDFHNASLHSAIEPLIIRNRPSDGWMILARSKEGMNSEAIASLEEVFLQFYPDRAFWFRFMDDLYNSQYKSEMMIKDLAFCFTIMAIVISLLGLFSLVAYSTEQRTKEVGIRKALGASIYDILNLLSREYSFLLSIAILLAIPISFYAMSEWLSGFAYRIHLNWWLFAIASFGALFLAYCVIGFSTAKAALSNPIDHLRDE